MLGPAVCSRRELDEGKHFEETVMAARLRHFAIVVKDLQKAARFYEGVFDLKRVGEETLDFASAVYLTDGVINLALLNYKSERGSGLKDPEGFGVIGADAVAKAPPDGYTVLFTFSSLSSSARLMSKLPYDPVADFAPV